jgi:hypothetical protein
MNGTPRPQLVDGADLASLIGPLYRDKQHWIILHPLPHFDAVLKFACIGMHLRAGAALCLLPVPAIGQTAVVLAIPKSETKPRTVLEGMGFGAGNELDRLEEEMAAGRDVVCLTRSQAVACAIANELRPFLKASPTEACTPLGNTERPRLDVLRRYRRRGPHYRRLIREGTLPPGVVSATMSKGQWDHALAAVYASGGILIEVDDNERAIALYQKRAMNQS